MNKKKITAIAAAVVMATGICTGVPAGTENDSLLTVTAEAADSDFVIETMDLDEDGTTEKVLAKYNGKGGDIVIPKEVEAVSRNAFDWEMKDKITSVTFKGNCVTVYGAFGGCLNLKKVVFEGDAAFDYGAFLECINLENVTIKGSIKKCIGDNAFRGCYKLKTFKISGNKYNFAIKSYAFFECHSLTSINIPSKCTAIGSYAFANCLNLAKLTIPAKTRFADVNNNEKTDALNVFEYNAIFRDKDCKDFFENFIANDKTKVYCSELCGYDDNGDEKYSIKQFTPKQLTLTVTKGSPAEKWAKSNNVKYVYASSSSSGGNAVAPENIKASKTSDSVTLTWDKADGADMYRVYKYNPETKKYEKYKDVKSAKCTVKGLKGNTKYKFKVVSYSKIDGKYVKGESSKAVSVTTKK